ncbi:hypothetical protein [Streptomyces sp. CB00271]|uniref:hypothetical protein n=1 Tax=Streptomyces sp. CB00271 TaxID=2750025 RepID=UPI001660064A|nr:hypothetical protein [Streptomyces sp. CB00271]QNQ37396.1 hypothetical protein HYC88_29380 [Streptomyces sp. CB00271]
MTGAAGVLPPRCAGRVDAPRARARVTGAAGEGREPVTDRVRVARAEHGLPGEELVIG